MPLQRVAERAQVAALNRGRDGGELHHVVLLLSTSQTSQSVRKRNVRNLQIRYR